jgi:hypothetical protein
MRLGTGVRDLAAHGSRLAVGCRYGVLMLDLAAL